MFIMEPDSGDLFVTGVVDREETDSYFLTVVAEDQGKKGAFMHNWGQKRWADGITMIINLIFFQIAYLSTIYPIPTKRSDAVDTIVVLFQQYFSC